MFEEQFVGRFRRLVSCYLDLVISKRSITHRQNHAAESVECQVGRA